MEQNKNIHYSISGGQVNIANDSSQIYATQNIYNQSSDEFENQINEIYQLIKEIDREDRELIIDAIDMIKEEKNKIQPNKKRLKNCITILSSIITSINGFPLVIEKVNGLINFITSTFKI